MIGWLGGWLVKSLCTGSYRYPSGNRLLRGGFKVELMKRLQVVSPKLAFASDASGSSCFTVRLFISPDLE